MFVALMLIAIRADAQDCSCEAQFRWLKKTFEENDAGFSYAVSRKGAEAYASHTEQMERKVQTITDLDTCVQAMSDWLKFFLFVHMWVGAKRDAAQPKEENPAEVRKRFAGWETYPIDMKAFGIRMKKMTVPGFEGIWSTGPYTMAVEKRGEEYVGVVLDADSVYWMPGQVKMKIMTAPDGAFNMTYYMRDHSAQTFNDVKLIGNNLLQAGFIILQRKEPEYKSNPDIHNYYRLMDASGPFLERLSEQTLLLRIPSFQHAWKKAIDSVLTANHDLIIHTQNLIIDLRNNGGGSDASYEHIIPYLYTNPIRSIGVELLSTPLNNKRMEDFMADPDWSEEEKKWARESLGKLKQHPGEFVNLDTSGVIIERYDTVYAFPENVAILVHENNGSTTEQFLLAARQSRKVKLFGTTTAGVLDISNMYTVTSPCGNIQLGYALSRSLRIPDMAIDDKGILPDYFIDKSVPSYQWISYVQGILERTK